MFQPTTAHEDEEPFNWYDDRWPHLMHNELLQQYCTMQRTPPWKFHEVPLDRIDVVEAGLVGCVDMKKLLMMAPKFAYRVLSYLAPNGTASVSCRVPETSTQEEYEDYANRKGFPKRLVLDQWRTRVIHHLSEESGLFEQLHEHTKLCMQRETKFTSGEIASIFLVEKPGTATLPDGSNCRMRVITDARRANARCKDSATFEMPPLDAILQVISDVSHGADGQQAKEYYAISADLRHWFFQLKLPNRLKPLFMFQTADGGTFVPTALPMGWRLAPIIAQFATWSLLLGKHKGSFAENMGIEDEAALRGAAAAPAWVPLWGDIECTVLVGAIFVVIDNIFIVCRDKNLIKKWKTRLQGTCDEVNATLKKAEGEEDPLKIVTLRRESLSSAICDESVEFMGIEFEYARWRTVGKRERSLDPLNEKMTKRELCSLLGEVHWDLRVRRQPALSHGPILLLHKLATPKTNDNETWDSATELRPEERSTLEAAVVEARTRPWCQRLAAWNSKGGIIRRFAVDASLEKPTDTSAGLRKIGIVDMDLGGSPSTCLWYQAEHEDPYIGVAELRAAVGAVSAIMVPAKLNMSKVSTTAAAASCEEKKERDDDSNSDVRLILIAGDSLCAKGWIERGYSDRGDARELLSELRERLGSVTRMMYIYVPSKMNVADGPSRWNIEDKRELRRLHNWTIGIPGDKDEAEFAEQYKATKSILDGMEAVGCAIAFKQGRQVAKSKVTRRGDMSADMGNQPSAPESY